jgi:hypothetical protein
LRFFTLTASLIVALAGNAIPVRAGMITGTFDGVGTLTPTGTPGIFIQNFTGDGDDATYGPFTALSQSTLDFTNPPNIFISNAMLTEIFQRGTLMGTGSGTGMGNGKGTATFTGDFVITGGTGDFAGFTGFAIFTGTITQTSPTTQSITGSYTQSFTSIPEPRTLVVLATGLLGFGWRRRKV